MLSHGSLLGKRVERVGERESVANQGCQVAKDERQIGAVDLRLRRLAWPSQQAGEGRRPFGRFLRAGHFALLVSRRHFVYCPVAAGQTVTADPRKLADDHQR